MDMAKSVYSHLMMRDAKMPGTIVRSSFIPEELGRVEYLLSDKTGTLTKNEMVLKKLHLGRVLFTSETARELSDHLLQSYKDEDTLPSLPAPAPSRKQNISALARDAVTAMALCHNVTPQHDNGQTIYQASSPDEIALVEFAERMQMTLVDRATTHLSLRNRVGREERYEILDVFPFTSEKKRMGIIVRDPQRGDITFYSKGADAVMGTIVRFSEWLEEECGNMAREGLRTLVFARKRLAPDAYALFSERYKAAKVTVHDREAAMNAVVEALEVDMELLGLTGVEDRLQDGVKATLETVRNAGIKVWMLTGDKVETGTCIAVSSKLIPRNQPIFRFACKTRAEAVDMLNSFKKKRNASLVIDGASLQLCIDDFPKEFIEAACDAPAVVCCRCAPTQKAAIVLLLRKHARCKTCAVGDGGNDVAMIQAADVGLGIVGKEGKQASLAADFSITQFAHISRLLLWHGRNSYKRTARLSQFVIHRGLIISVIQTVFSTVFYFSTVAIYSGWLLVGYTTIYTMAPVFALVLDEDVSEEIAFTYPELYKELRKGRSLSYKTFYIWVLKSIYQGSVIMLGAVWLFDDDFIHIQSISFTALILTELLMAALEMHRWHWVIIVAELVSIVFYVSSFYLLPSYFDLAFIQSLAFCWKASYVVLYGTWHVVCFHDVIDVRTLYVRAKLRRGAYPLLCCSRASRCLLR